MTQQHLCVALDTFTLSVEISTDWPTAVPSAVELHPFLKWSSYRKIVFSLLSENVSNDNMHERKAASHLSKLHNVAIHLWPAADVRPVFFGSDKRHRTGNAYVLYWNTVCVTATKTLSNILPTLFGSYTLTAQLRLCQTGWAAPKA